MNCSISKVVGEEKQSSSQEEVKKIADALEWCLDRSGCEDLDNNDLDSTGRTSVSSGASHCSCENSAAEVHFNASRDNNASLDLMDESDNEYSDNSDISVDDFDWGNLEENDSVDVDRVSAQSSQSSHDYEGMSDGLELMDALSDISDEVTRQVTIAIDIDSSSGDNMSESSEGGQAHADYDREDESDYEEYPDDEGEEEDVDVDFDDGGFSDGVLASDDSDSNYADNISRESSLSDVSFHGVQNRQPPELQPPRLAHPPPAAEPPQPIPIPPPSGNQQNGCVVPPAPAKDSSAAVVNKDGPTTPSTSTVPLEGGDSGDDRLCCICLDNHSSHIVVPCGHLCLCQDCKELLVTDENHRKKKKCPMCKTAFTIIIKVFK